MKIRGEQDELRAEREKIAGILESKAKLKKLIKDELTADAKKFGDAACRRWCTRRRAGAGRDRTGRSEPMTVVLSEKGWIRAAKGHDVDASTLSYRDGDGLLGAVRSRSTQQVASSRGCTTMLKPTSPTAAGMARPMRAQRVPGRSSR